jgi:hypothetical protein
MDLPDFAPEDRDDVRHALSKLHLTPAHLGWFWIIVGVVTSVITVVMGWLLVQRGKPAGFATYLAVVTLATQAAMYPPDIDDIYPDRPVFQAIVLALTVTGVSGLFILPLVFPDGRFVPRWTVFVAMFIVAQFVLFWDSPGFLESIAVEVVGTILLVAILVGAPIYRYRRVSTPEQRRQTHWVMLGFVIGIPSFFAGDALMRNIDSSPQGIASLLGFMILIQIGFNLPFMAVAAGILFHRLFDIDVILGRTLTWLAMTGAVVGAYVGIVLGIGSLLGTDDSLILSLLATGLVAVAFSGRSTASCSASAMILTPSFPGLGTGSRTRSAPPTSCPRSSEPRLRRCACPMPPSSSIAPAVPSWLPSPAPRRCRRCAFR